MVDYGIFSNRDVDRGEATYVAALDFVVLSLLDYLEDLLDGRGDVRAGAADLDNVLGSGISSLGTDLDRQCLVLADNTRCTLDTTYD